MNSFPVWSISLHHALGGKPLWLVVCGHRNGPEAQSQAMLAGHRLTRVLGGFSGHLPLDARWAAYYLRVNEVVVVATYTALSDGSEAMRAAGAARGALLEACGRPSDVTLAALSRCGAEVQLALRRAVSGYGRIYGIGTAKFDLAGAQLSPDAPPDDAASAGLRGANDVTSPAAPAAACDAWALAGAKASALCEALPRALRPSAAAQGASALPRGCWLDSPAAASGEALAGYLRLHSAGRAAAAPRQAALLPPALLQAVAAAEARAAAAGGSGSGAGHSLQGEASALSPYRAVGRGDLWASSPLSPPAGAEEGIFSIPHAAAFAPPSLPEFTVTIRVAAQCLETATLTAPPGEARASSGTVSGVCQLRYMYGNALPAELEESGHGPLSLVLHFSAGGPVESLTFSEPSSSGSSCGGGGGGAAARDIAIPAGNSAAAIIPITLSLPARPPGLRTYAPGELGAITYRLSSALALPPVLTASAIARASHGEDDLHRHRHTDLLLKTCLDASRSGVAATQVQFLVALPPLPANSGAYATPVCVPLAQWSQPRAQLLWALTEGLPPAGPSDASGTSASVAAGGAAGGAAGAESALPTLSAYFAPGKAQVFRARVPVAEGAALASAQAAAAAAPVNLAVHARFTFTNALVVPVTLTAKGGDAGAGSGSSSSSSAFGGSARPRPGSHSQQPLTQDVDASGMALRVDVIGLMVKCSSSVRCLFKT